MNSFYRVKNTGFTIIELLVVILMLGVVTAIAIPSYKRYLINANIQSVSSTLLIDAQYMQRWFSACGNYLLNTRSIKTPQCFNDSDTDKVVAWPQLPYPVYPDISAALYRIKFTSAIPLANNTDANSFRLVASPVCGTIQENDGCVCIDQDSNVINHTNSSCNNSSALCGCVS